MIKYFKIYVSSVVLFFIANTAAHALCDFEKVLIGSSLNSFQNKFVGDAGTNSSKLHGYDIPIERICDDFEYICVIEDHLNLVRIRKAQFYMMPAAIRLRCIMGILCRACVVGWVGPGDMWNVICVKQEVQVEHFSRPTCEWIFKGPNALIIHSESYSVS